MGENVRMRWNKSMLPNTSQNVNACNIIKQSVEDKACFNAVIATCCRYITGYNS